MIVGAHDCLYFLCQDPNELPWALCYILTDPAQHCVSPGDNYYSGMLIVRNNYTFLCDAYIASLALHESKNLLSTTQHSIFVEHVYN